MLLDSTARGMGSIRMSALSMRGEAESRIHATD
jgi:hypothetical protein